MKRALFAVLATVLCCSLLPRASCAQGGGIAGVDMGAVVPKEAMEDFSDPGGILSPFVGYMLNDYLGLMGQAHVLGMPNENRPGLLDDDATWAAGATAGPRVAVRLRGAEIYGTGQAGIFTGLAPHSSITDTSWAYSAGAGLNIPVTDHLLLGTFTRYNRLYQRVHGRGDVKFISAGISLTYDTRPPRAAPPAPAKVAQAAPPAPAPAPAVKKKLVLRGVNFDFDKSDIRPDARPVLDEAIATLKQEGTVSVVAEGHTDSVGTEEYNKRLSMRRAAAVREYLVQGGIDRSRVQIEGYGESRPVASNDTADGRAQNRRVELRVVD